MDDKEYNGWTNYSTWRVNLEIFDGHFYTEGEQVTADYCEAYAKTIVYYGSSEGFALDYAYAFLDQVNWHEIAKHLNEK